MSRKPYKFNSPGKAGTAATFGLLLAVVIRIWEAGLEIKRLNQWSLLAEGHRVSSYEMQKIQSLINSSSRISLVLVILTASAFLFWFHRVYANLYAFRIEGLKCTPAQVVGFFFIPYISLFYPAKNAQEIWRASDPETSGSRDWQAQKKSRLVYLWWLAYIFAGFTIVLAIFELIRVNQEIVSLDNSGSLSSAAVRSLAAQLANWSKLLIAGYFFSVVAALFAAQIIRRVNDRQDRKFSNLTQAGFFQLPEPPHPVTVERHSQSVSPGFFAIIGGVLLIMLGLFVATPSIYDIINGHAYYSRQTSLIILILAGVLPTAAGFFITRKGFRRRREKSGVISVSGTPRP